MDVSTIGGDDANRSCSRGCFPFTLDFLTEILQQLIATGCLPEQPVESN